MDDQTKENMDVLDEPKLTEKELKSLSKLYTLIVQDQRYSNDNANITNMENLLKDIEFNDTHLVDILTKIDPYKMLYFLKKSSKDVDNNSSEIEYVIDEQRMDRLILNLQTQDIKRF